MNATATVWGSIMQQLTLSGSAGLIRTKTDQDVLFAGTQPASVAASNYTSEAVLYSINVAYRATEKLGLNLMFQQVRSNAEFDPAFLQYPVNNSSDGVKSISWLKTVENTVNFAADYALARNISCGVAYSYRSYNDDRNSAYDGSLHSVTGTLTAKW
jgi:predicted porin